MTHLSKLEISALIRELAVDFRKYDLSTNPGVQEAVGGIIRPIQATDTADDLVARLTRLAFLPGQEMHPLVIIAKVLCVQESIGPTSGHKYAFTEEDKQAAFESLRTLAESPSSSPFESSVWHSYGWYLMYGPKQTSIEVEPLDKGSLARRRKSSDQVNARAQREQAWWNLAVGRRLSRLFRLLRANANETELDRANANETELDQQALAFWQKSAEQGNAGAQYYLGRALGFRALNTPTNAAELGREAVALLRKSALQGNADAQYDLAKVLIRELRGGKTPTNAAELDREADVLLRESAAQGNADAQKYLIERLRGVKRNPANEAELNKEVVALWHKLADEYGNVEAMYMLGSSYQSGANGVLENGRLAFKYLSMASANGHQVAGSSGLIDVDVPEHPSFGIKAAAEKNDRNALVGIREELEQMTWCIFQAVWGNNLSLAAASYIHPPGSSRPDFSVTDLNLMEPRLRRHVLAACLGPESNLPSKVKDILGGKFAKLAEQMKRFPEAGYQRVQREFAQRQEAPLQQPLIAGDRAPSR